MWKFWYVINMFVETYKQCYEVIGVEVFLDKFMIGQ